MGPHTRMLFWVLKSVEFCRFLSELAGISGLIADPAYMGSGAVFTGTGGFLALHADFNWQPKYRLDRRVNTFVYLNEDWDDAWGGHLELWNRSLTGCHARIKPSFNRFAVFTTTDFSYHGYPAPLACPQNRMRRSISMYYYTDAAVSGERPIEDCLGHRCPRQGGFQHSTLWVKPQTCTSCTDASCRACGRM